MHLQKLRKKCILKIYFSQKKFSQNMKRNRLFQMKPKIWYIIYFFLKKTRKKFHSILFQTPKPCAKNSAKTWNVKTFFRWKSKSDTLSTFFKKKRARFFIPKSFQNGKLRKKIQPKHDTQSSFSDENQNMIRNQGSHFWKVEKVTENNFSFLQKYF